MKNPSYLINYNLIKFFEFIRKGYSATEIGKSEANYNDSLFELTVDALITFKSNIFTTKT